MVEFCSYSMSICYDFFIKIVGKGHCQLDTLSRLPILKSKYMAPLIIRCLRLNCLTSHYSDLWTEVADDSINKENWAVNDVRLINEQEHDWDDLSFEKWDWKTPLMLDFSRRQALVEIDVLTALALDLHIEELISIYRVQFPVLRSYEMVDQFDQKGRRIPNTKRKNQGSKEFREALKDWNGESPLTVSWEIDNGLQTVTKTFYPPFEGVDREKDYEIAYNEFQKRFQD